MARVETLTAYRSSFKYIQRNNPRKDELHEKIKKGIPPEYSFNDFINDFGNYTSSLIIGKNTERAILLPKENIFVREIGENSCKWRIVPLTGKQGIPVRIIKTDTGRQYNFNSKSAAIYEHNVYIYQKKDFAIIVFHRQSGSGCKSVFLEVANKMLWDKGIKLEMELYLPLLSSQNNVEPVKLQLQYKRSNTSSDIAESIHKRKHNEVIRELTLNLKSDENNKIKQMIKDVQIGKIDKDVAFVKITGSYLNDENYNNAKLYFRIGKRNFPVMWNEFDSIIGNYDITEELHSKIKNDIDFVEALTELTDNYYYSIESEENANV